MRHVEEERLWQTATGRAIARGTTPRMVHAEDEGDRSAAVVLIVVLLGAIATKSGLAALISGAGLAGAVGVALGVFLVLAAGCTIVAALCRAKVRRARAVFLQFDDGQRLRVPADWMREAVARPIGRPGRDD